MGETEAVVAFVDVFCKGVIYGGCGYKTELAFFASVLAKRSFAADNTMVGSWLIRGSDRIHNQLGWAIIYRTV
jgi:hypothetical protein